MSMIESVRNYMLTCPLLEDGLMSVDNISDEPTSYSISPLPIEPILKDFINGSSLRRYQFQFSTRESTVEILQNIENSGFYEELSEWLEVQTEIENFPVLSEDKKTESIKALSEGFLLNQDNAGLTGVYACTIELQYKKERIDING